MTLADRLRQEGLEKGINEGHLIEARVNLRRVLIRRELAISPEDLARIEACEDLDMLHRWLDEAIDAVCSVDALR